ncbi:hypothetical protein Tco_1069714 [Tanacetum coccineum]|uniref:Retrovirus-related Pol polyprotein from transposon TNT 1-94-like beta-barrel domain-containing protein n=1 Tax=Tanacetum coccineum TaxID=301880 RepID=A0ABQ5HL71_9ASTR
MDNEKAVQAQTTEMKKHKNLCLNQFVNEPKVVSEPKVWSDAPIIEEYESDSEDEHVSLLTKEQEIPSFAFINTDKHIRPVWNNVQRVNHQNQFVPKAVLTRTGKIQVNTARTSGTNTVNTARHNFNTQAVPTNAARKVNTVKPIVNNVRPKAGLELAPIVNNVRPKAGFHKSVSPFRKPFNRTTALRTNFSKQKVNTAEVNAVSTVGGKRETAVKSSAGCNWRPKRHYWNKVSKYNGGSSPRNCDYPQRALQNKGIVDSGCSRHMTGNKAYLAEYQDFNGGPVAFGGSKGYITGKGKIKIGKLDFEDVCFVKELQHFNLFSVSQMCDKKNKVLFTDTECLVLSPEFKLPDENHVLLRIPRQNNMYSFNLENIVPSGGLACLIAKAIIDESNKWHRRLGVMITVKNITKLEGKPCKRYITAKVAGKPASISKASIRSDLLFDDVDGIDSLLDQVIFDAIQLMGYEGDLNGKHFSGNVTPLFDSMLAQPTEDEGVTLERQSELQPTPSPTHLSTDQHETQTDPSPRPSPTTHIPNSILEGSGGNHGGQSSSNRSLSENKGGMTLQTKDTLDYMETKDAQDMWRTRYVVHKEEESAENGVSTEDALSTAQPKVSTDKEKVSTNKEKFNTDKPKDSTDKEEVSTDRPDEGTADQTKGRSATQTAPTTTTPTIFGDDETIAQVLIIMSQNKEKLKEKEKGVELKDVEETERPRPTSTRSLLTLKPLPKIDPQDKGKKKIEEEDESDTESEGITEAEKKFKQLARNEEVARKVQEDWEAEKELKKLAKEKAIKATLSNEYDFIQARLNADKILAEKL